MTATTKNLTREDEMTRGRIVADADFVVGDIDRRIFGSFVEHIGRCVYGGIYEPGHPTADRNGFRTDVIELTKELGVTIVRYPGGNFLSGYNWEDGVGPKEARPRRLDLAWFVTETNEFGTNEFMDWCKAAAVEPMFCVNLGSRGADDARRLVEYTNHPGGTQLSDLRRAHGYPDPHAIQFWNLGNEMDGNWQIGHKTAEEYGRAALETAKVMRWVDPNLQLSACGSSYRHMASFGQWEYDVLDICYDAVEYLSLHMYFNNPHDSFASFSSDIDIMDKFIKEVVAICDAVGAKRRSDKRIMLCFDEYNVWYKVQQQDGLKPIPGWPVAPTYNEETYDFQDALVLGGSILTLLNNCDRVKAACLAQLVNVIAPIMTETGGPAWRQTIFYPFADASRLGHGRVLRTVSTSDAFVGKENIQAPYLISSTIYDPETGRLTILALNRHEYEAMDLDVDVRGFAGNMTLAEATELHHEDLKATNTASAPEVVARAPLVGVGIDGSRVTAKLKPTSWNVISLRV